MNVKKYKRYFTVYTKKYLHIFLFVILFLFHIRYGIIPAWSNVNSDFPNYYTSSRLLLEHKNAANIYDDNWFQQKIYDYGIKEPGKFSPFPPPTIFIMVPEALLSPIDAKRIFILINLIVLVATAYIITKISAFSFIGAVNIIFLSGAALTNNFIFGQFYLILLFFILLGYHIFLNSDKYSVGIFWGIGAAIKYVPVIYIPILIMTKKWKSLASLIITILVINLAAGFLLGFDIYVQFFRSELFPHLNGELSHQSSYAVQFQSWNSFLRNIFVYDRMENSSPLIDSSFLFNFFRLFVYLFFLITSVVTIYIIRNQDELVPSSIAILTLLVLVLAPASASYHVLLLIIPVVILLSLSARKYHVYYLIFAILYVIISFSPLVLNKMDRNTYGLFCMYLRLWVEVVFYLVAIKFVLVLKRESAYDRFTLRSVIPKSSPSVEES